MFNMGFTEMLLIAIVALIFIGPKQLPHVAKIIARTLNEFKRATADITKPLADIKSDLTKEAQSLKQAQEKSAEWINRETEELLKSKKIEAKATLAKEGASVEKGQLTTKVTDHES